MYGVELTRRFFVGQEKCNQNLKREKGNLKLSKPLEGQRVCPKVCLINIQLSCCWQASDPLSEVLLVWSLVSDDLLLVEIWILTAVKRMLLKVKLLRTLRVIQTPDVLNALWGCPSWSWLKKYAELQQELWISDKYRQVTHQNDHESFFGLQQLVDEWSRPSL